MMTIADEIKNTELISLDGKTLPAEFHIWVTDDKDPQMVKLSLRFLDRNLTQIDRDYFSALVSIRRELEKENILINCYGCSKNVYAPPMSINMSAGEKAYRLKIGKQPTFIDIVRIFDTGADVIPVTVEEQKAFFEEWTKSITKPKS